VSADRLRVMPWWHSQAWRVTGAIMASIFLVGWGYAGWWAAHQRAHDTPPVFAFVLVPVAALGPRFPSWPEFIVMAILNIAVWAAILYGGLTLAARFRR
jgi:hypothetical protein